MIALIVPTGLAEPGGRRWSGGGSGWRPARRRRPCPASGTGASARPAPRLLPPDRRRARARTASDSSCMPSWFIWVASWTWVSASSRRPNSRSDALRARSTSPRQDGESRSARISRRCMVFWSSGSTESAASSASAGSPRWARSSARLSFSSTSLLGQLGGPGVFLEGLVLVVVPPEQVAGREGREELRVALGPSWPATRKRAMRSLVRSSFSEDLEGVAEDVDRAVVEIGVGRREVDRGRTDCSGVLLDVEHGNSSSSRDVGEPVLGLEPAGDLVGPWRPRRGGGRAAGGSRRGPSRRP